MSILVGDFIERSWAYLTTKNLLEKATVDALESENLRKKALEMALKYKFVTELTSMVVTKDTQIEQQHASDPSVENQIHIANQIDIDIANASLNNLISKGFSSAKLRCKKAPRAASFLNLSESASATRRSSPFACKLPSTIFGRGGGGGQKQSKKKTAQSGSTAKKHNRVAILDCDHVDASLLKGDTRQLPMERTSMMEYDDEHEDEDDVSRSNEDEEQGNVALEEQKKTDNLQSLLKIDQKQLDELCEEVWPTLADKMAECPIDHVTAAIVQMAYSQNVDISVLADMHKEEKVLLILAEMVGLLKDEETRASLSTDIFENKDKKSTSLYIKKDENGEKFDVCYSDQSIRSFDFLFKAIAFLIKLDKVSSNSFQNSLLQLLATNVGSTGTSEIDILAKKIINAIQ